MKPAGKLIVGLELGGSDSTGYGNPLPHVLDSVIPVPLSYLGDQHFYGKEKTRRGNCDFVECKNKEYMFTPLQHGGFPKISVLTIVLST
ncbi:hypothetical protein V6N11_064407 [Hibiscus sabdariffa]|uniref:Uncharacterized protein n=1 Tax=Hibiscus sabdariffa TaxID=183260 RepID=A0ABR1ZCK4_9ROSI